MASSSSGLESYARSVLRIVIGFTFTCHGCQKLLGLFGGMGGRAAKAHLFSLMWVAGCIETIGGALILLGLFTIPVAFILCGEMAVAYFMQHYPHGIFPIRNGGELAVLYCFIFLYLLVAGPGVVSLDSIVHRKHRY